MSLINILRDLVRSRGLGDVYKRQDVEREIRDLRKIAEKELFREAERR